MINELNRITNWFKEYQWNIDRESWKELYLKLIQEELDETNLALKENNLVEFLDWCIDLFWVMQWYKYFWWNLDDIKIEPFIIMFNNINVSFNDIITSNLIIDLINVVADSNYTKVLELQTKWEKVGKVIKGPNFVSPTEWIKDIIKKYNITLITEYEILWQQ